MYQFFVPGGAGLYYSEVALKEYYGRLFYWVKSAIPKTLMQTAYHGHTKTKTNSQITMAKTLRQEKQYQTNIPRRSHGLMNVGPRERPKWE